MTGASSDDLAALTAAHNARLSAIDPLVAPATEPVLGPPPVGGPTPPFGIRSEELLVVPGAAGVARTTTADPDSMVACWGTLTTHSLLMARVAGDDPAASMDALLTRFREYVAAQPLDDHGESSATVSWPSRDTVMALPLLRHGMTVTAQVAARSMGRPAPFSMVPGGVTVRPIEAADLDAATALEVEVVAWDAQFGGVFLRESTPRRAREEIAGRIGADPASAWVAVHGGEVVGYAAVDWPGNAAWISGTVSTDPRLVAYVGCQSVRADGRGAGIGSALATHVHDELDAAGIETTLLHHAVLNPLSTPFWARRGYRPVRSIWEVSPHSLMR